MELSVLQAAILALYYWFAQWYIFYSAINVFLGPLCTGLFCGIVLGDIPTAMKIAATIQPMFLAFTGAGGTVVWDETAATMGGCVITMISGLDTSQVVTIAVPLSLLCAQLHTLRRIIMVYPVQRADEYAKTCNTKGILFMAFWWPTIVKFFIFGVPMFLALYFGAEAVGSFMNSLPVWITNALGATGKLLPALGFAMTVNVIGRPQFLPFFLGGFFLAQYSGLSGIPLALSGLFVAFMYYLILQASDKEEVVDEGSQAAVEADKEGKKLLTKKDVNNLAWRWNVYCEMSNSFARLQSLACLLYTSRQGRISRCHICRLAASGKNPAVICVRHSLYMPSHNRFCLHTPARVDANPSLWDFHDTDANTAFSPARCHMPAQTLGTLSHPVPIPLPFARHRL